MQQTRFFSPLRRISFHLSLLAAATALSCQAEDDGPPATVVDEDGSWVLERFQLKRDGEFRTPLTEKESLSFILHFDNEVQKAVIAGCSTSKTAEPDVRSGGCAAKSSPDDRFWTCYCFDYDFVGDEMSWTLSKTQKPGGRLLTAPEISYAAAKQSTVHVYPDQEIASVAIFAPLPNYTTDDAGGIFQSDGKVSRYEFRHRSRLAELRESGCLKTCGASE